ncbi:MULTISPECIES: co-regulatory protein PtrA N-terminal domain-containing protein [Pseudomonas]|jgi:hypothetical protein|uniref:Uncharacterized protein n=3 Tax=Pseudomonas TaxID=286 RepID=A0AB36CV11_9PSED|nr:MULTISPECIES: co-regulatory protein PtrA N-terminal domain-containing protein [Pseudomonas]AVX92092.1 hypothetical protein PkP19E3_29045 [Pseudomonas koreensis]AVX93332.1 hypothetical protein PkP19E3_35140 [Pseudomonas koreensis]KAE9645875.1 hypothetical protein EJA70_09630 [Pseudomonas sp. PB103]MBA5983624.1 hypothetical protein [Pseudomonas sp. MD195_PC81_125]MBC2691924.1 hypothetical protein [Pseudomonas kielensis]
MKIAQIFALASALVLSSVALAEGGGDRTFEKMMVANDLAMEKYVAKEGKIEPVVSSDAKDETDEM